MATLSPAYSPAAAFPPRDAETRATEDLDRKGRLAKGVDLSDGAPRTDNRTDIEVGFSRATAGSSWCRCSARGAAGLAGARRAVRLTSGMKGGAVPLLGWPRWRRKRGSGEHRLRAGRRAYGFEPDLISGRPFDLSGCAASADPW